MRDLETGENHRLTRKGTWNESQEFAEWSVISPDGRQVAYSWRDENNFYHLRTIGFEDEGGGAQPRVLIRADADTPYLIPTTGLPGGKRVACSVWRGDGTIDLVLVSADDGTVTRLKSLEWRTSVFAAASPDGRFLAYDVQQSPDEDKFNIRVIVIDGSRDIPLIEHAGSDSVWGGPPTVPDFCSAVTGEAAMMYGSFLFMTARRRAGRGLSGAAPVRRWG